MSQSSELCVITAPDSHSPGAAAHCGSGGRGEASHDSSRVGENFPAASSMINGLARAASRSPLSLRPLPLHTCCSHEEPDSVTTHPESIHFLFSMLSAVCDVTKGSKVLPKFTETACGLRRHRTETGATASCELFLLHNNTRLYLFCFFQWLNIF